MTRKRSSTTEVPLRTYLARLIWVCVLPLLVLAIWLAYDRARASHAQRNEQAAAQARNFAAIVDQQLELRIRALTMLATSPLVDDPNHWPDLYREAQSFRENFGSHVVFADTGEPMRMLLNTRRPFGEKLPPLPRPAGHAAAPTAVATMKPAVGDTFPSPLANETLIAIAAPAVREGKAAYVLIAAVATERFQASLNQFVLSDEWAMTLRDGRGAIIARRAPEGFDSSRDVGTGGRFVAASSFSPWSVELEIPRAAQWAPLAKTGAALLLGLAGATLISVWGGLRASRRLGRAVADLAQETNGAPRTSEIAEIRQVHTVLDEATAKLRESEERFRKLFDAAPLAMFQVGADEAIVARNARFDRLFGYAETDLATLPDWWRLAGTDGRKRNQITSDWKAAVAQAARTGADIEAGEEELACKDGSSRIVEITGIALKPGVLIAFADVTERRRAEADLRLWAEAFEQADLALAIGDARSNTLVAVNPAFARERGYEPAEMAGMPIPRLFPSDRIEEARAMIAALDATSHGVFEIEHAAKDGRRFPVLLDITVLRDADGKPVRRVAYALDLTERRLAERALADAQAAALAEQKRARLAALNQMEDANAARKNAEAALDALQSSEARLRAIYENAVAGIALIDAGGRIEQGNPALCAMLGYTEDELRQRDPASLVHPEDREAVKAQLARLRSGEVRRFEMELRYLHRSGHVVWLHEFSSLLSESAREPARLVTLVTDITEKKRTEAALQRLNAELERRVAERTAELTAANRELDSFAYAVSHDLRAPLRAMSGFSQALFEDFGHALPGDAKDYLDHIGLASRKMSELIDGLLTLSRCTRGNLRRDAVDLSAVASRRLDALAQSDPQRNVAWQVEPGLAAQGDGRMIEALLENLLQNAWKYTGRTPNPEIRVHACELDGQPAICVADNGAGFDMDHAGRLFEPFQRLHRQDEFPGIGIGLATVQRIVQRHGGRIVAQGKPGKGATFCFTLPTPGAAPTESLQATERETV